MGKRLVLQDGPFSGLSILVSENRIEHQVIHVIECEFEKYYYRIDHKRMDTGLVEPCLVLDNMEPKKDSIVQAALGLDPELTTNPENVIAIAIHALNETLSQGIDVNVHH